MIKVAREPVPYNALNNTGTLTGHAGSGRIERTLPLSKLISTPSILATSASHLDSPLVCRNICLRLYVSTQASGSHYMAGGKYCRRCECYLITQEMFCECCGMRLRASSSARAYKEKVRASDLRYDERSKTRIA